MLQIELVMFPMPLKVEGHTVPHLKARVSGKLVSRGLCNGTTFSLCNLLLKSVYLLHKGGLGWFVSLSTVTKNSFTHGWRTGPFFFKFYTVRFSQRWFYYHLKIFKKYEFPKNLKVVAQKLCPPCPFQF